MPILRKAALGVFVLMLAGCRAAQIRQAAPETLGPHADLLEAEDLSSFVLLGPDTDISQTTSFAGVFHAIPGTSDYEKARIHYLFERLKGSDNQFVRNGECHSNAHAVLFLRWKYQRYRREAKTAEDFIANVASSSRKTGDEYLMKDRDGRTYPVKTVLRNECRLLDVKLQEYAREAARGGAAKAFLESKGQIPYDSPASVKKDSPVAENTFHR